MPWGHIPKARCSICSEGHAGWDKGPQGLWHGWLTKRAMQDLPADHKFFSIVAYVSTKARGHRCNGQTELGKRETGNSWLPAQASNHTATLCISLCIWTGVIFKMCVFTQGPGLYIACLLMLPCCARSLLSRRSALLTYFIIVLYHLLLVKDLVVSSWYSTEFAIHYISNNF